MISMAPRGSGLPAYAPHRDLLYRMHAWIGDGIKSLNDLTPTELTQSTEVARELATLVAACRARSIKDADIAHALELVRVKYPVGYGCVLHAVMITWFKRYRTFIGEALPAPDHVNGPAAAGKLENAEGRVDAMIKKDGDGNA